MNLNRLLVYVSLLIYSARSATYGPSSTATAPTNPTQVNSAIAGRRVTITAKNSLSVNTGSGGDLFIAELYTNNASCDANLYTYSCKPSCSPYTSPNTPSKSCLSSSHVTVPTGPNWVIATVADNGDGTYTADYAPELTGTYDLNIGLAVPGGLRGKYYDNMWFLNSPTINRVDSSISFNWGLSAITTFGVDYVSVRWEGKLKPAYSQTYTIYVTADDGVRLWLDRRLIIDNWSTCCNESWANVALSAGYLHDIKIDYREIQGIASIDLSWSAPSVAKEIIPSSALYSVDQISGSPIKGIVITEADPPNSVQTTASGPGLTASIVAGPVVSGNKFTVLAKDLFGNLLTAQSGSAVWTVTGSGPGVVVGAIGYGYGPYYNGSWSTTVSGAYTLSVKLGGNHITGSPFLLSCGPAITSAGNSVAFGSGLTSGTVGLSSSFWVQARDQYGNNVTWGTDPVKVTLSGTNAPTAGITYISNGLYQVFYTPIISGSLTIIVKIGTTLILTSSGSFTSTIAVGSVHAPSCTANPSGTGVAGVQSSFAITARDEFGNQLTTGGGGIITFSLSLTGPASLTHDSITHAGSGVYTTLFTPTLVGTYQMVAMLGTVPISGSPFTVVVSPGAPVASTSTASGSSLSTAISGIQQSFNVSARDSQSNLIAVDAAVVTAVVSCGGVSGSSSWLGGGLYKIIYTPSTKGSSCSLTVQIGGSNINGSPFTLKVTAGAAESSTSTVSGSGLSTSIAGVGVSLSVVLKDLSSNLLVTGGNQLTVSIAQPDNSLLPYSLVDYGTGSYTISYTPKQTGSHSATIKLAHVGGLDATYYNDQVMVLVNTANVLDPIIHHDWGYSPAITGLPADMFSIRWSGKIMSSTSEIYRFTIPLYANTGARLYISTSTQPGSAKLVIDAWSSAIGAGDVFGDIAMVANQLVNIGIEFHGDLGQAQIGLYWSSGSLSKQLVPSTALYYIRHIASSPYTGTNLLSILFPIIPFVEEKGLEVVDV
uniref:PA14 domain-containing protein n=1 Tax=Spongospora subterranea TaxID=70186 RepID=A0A0H5QVC4_9EUKA|eukprot:CRZ05546.1 hypothetical protein [Spongospora subterranea]